MTNAENTETSTPVPLPVSPVDARIRNNFREVVAVIDASGAVETLDAVLVKRNPKTGKIQGRPRSITTRALLVVGVMNFLDDRPGEVTSITDTFNTLPEDLLRELKVPAAIKPGKVPHFKVDHVWNRFAEACNASQIFPGKRLKIVDGTPVNQFKAKQLDAKHLQPDLEEHELYTEPTRNCSNRGTERTIPLTPEEQATRKALLDGVTDAMLLATFPEDYEHDGSWAVDWTDIESWAITYRKGEETSADPDAKWGRRRRKGSRTPAGSGKKGPPETAHANPTGDAAYEKDKNELYFGYNAHLAVTGAKEGCPELAGSLRLTPANDMIGVAPTLVEMTDALLDAGRTVSALTVDQGYSMKKDETWLIPLSDRGVMVTFELKQDQLGRHGTFNGAVLIGGVPHCPMTPDGLTNEKLLAPKAPRSEWGTYWENRDRLDQYAFRPLGARKPDLVQRFQCPAYANKVRCPLQAKSMSLPADKNIPEIYDVPDVPPSCCTSPNMTLSREVGLGARQAEPYGSRGWIEKYKSRTSVERFNSTIKFEQRIDRAEIRVLGLTKVTLMLAFACTAANIRHVRNWRDSQAVEASAGTKDSDFAVAS